MNRLALKRDISAERRDRNAANGDCINETLEGTHGKATNGRRCYRCWLVHRHGAVIVAQLGIPLGAQP